MGFNSRFKGLNEKYFKIIWKYAVFWDAMGYNEISDISVECSVAVCFIFSH